MRGGVARVDDARAMREAFGLRLYALLDERGWSQSELARRAGMGRPQVSRYVLGMESPRYRQLVRLRDALGCTWGELMGE